MHRSKLDIGGADAGAGGMSISSSSKEEIGASMRVDYEVVSVMPTVDMCLLRYWSYSDAMPIFQ